MGLLDLLVAKKSDASKVEAYLPLLQQSSERGYNLLMNLLEWSRVQTGRIKAQPATLELKSLVERNINLLDNQAKQKNINIISYIDQSKVLADTQMFDTVIRNLLSNAIKFTPTNGLVEISAIKMDKEVEISIKDNGIGMTPQDIDKLFKMDVAHSTKGTANETGTGLGLLLCKEFVEKNDGLIRVESEEGNGSTFYVRIPAV